MMGMLNRIIVVVAVILLAGGVGRAELATMHLRDGRSLTVELMQVDRGQIQWKVSASVTQVQQTLRSQIDYVDFTPTNEWEAAEAAFQSGKLNEAINLYTTVLNAPASQFYPMPGNFASLAKVRLLDCHRIRMDMKAIAAQAAIVRDEFADLPPSHRKLDPEVTAWVAISRQNWQAAIDAVTDVKIPTPETYLVRGMAYEGIGALEEAIRQYAGAYVLNFGGPTELTRTSLRRSAEMLAKLKNQDRQNELQGLVKIYQDLFGKGNLWEGAPEWLVKLAAGELVVMSELTEGLDAPEKPDGESGPLGQKSAELASLPPLADREWILTDELPHRAYVEGPGEADVSRTVEGGASESGKGYAFDGSGGKVMVSGVAASQPFMRIRGDLTPETTDGIIAEMKGGAGGFGVYLKKGEIMFAWAPNGAKVEAFTLGKIEEGSRGHFVITIGSDRKVRVSGLGLEQQEVLSLKTRKKGLEILDNQKLFLGDMHSQKPPNEGWPQSTPFKGTIHHFSVVCGKNGEQLKELQLKAFSGKNPRFTPPLAEEAPKEEPNKGKE